MKRIFTLILGLCLLVSCTEFVLDYGADSFVLRSHDVDMVTKAGVPFVENTSYWFFAFNNSEADGTPEFDYPAVIQCTGTESGEGTINFPDGTRSHFGGRSMDFYGLTFADSDASHWSDALFTTTDSQSPKYLLQRDSDGSLGDLRLGVLKNVSSENTTGRLDVDFHHALSRLHFVAARQDVANLEGIYITSIDVYDYDAATLDMGNGAWTAVGDTTKRRIYSYQPAVATNPDQDKKLTSASSVVTDCLVFPRASGPKPMKVVVNTYNPTTGDATQDNNSQALRQEFDIPVDLERNHEYTLSITITNKGVRIIILTPQEADWIQVDQGEINLGQPVTFGGITWADRNIGATFAPANNKLENITNIRDWDNMRGYYFQFGRNVPYFFLKNRKIGSNTNLTKDFANNDYTYCITTKDRINAPFALLDGNSVQAAYDAATANKSWADVSTTGVMPLAFNNTKLDVYGPVNYIDISDYDGTPADAKRFAVVVGGATDDEPWWKIDKSKQDWGIPHTWDDVSRQPCPKGWRIPTRDDWAYIMPLCKRTGDITFNPGDPSASATQTVTYSYKDKDGIVHEIKDFKYVPKENRDFNNHYRNRKVEDGVYWWAETGGDRYDVRINGALYKGFEESLGDPVGDYTTQYLCVSPSTNITRGTLYAIKCVGTAAAYRLKWEFIIHEDMPSVGARNNVPIYPVTMRISRYVSNASERLTNLQDLKQLDWEHPAEVMELPDCGYLFSEKTPVLVNSGNETIYACSTIDPVEGWYYAVRLKYNNFSDAGSYASRYLMLIKMRRAYGMCIRPVRDNSVIID